MADQPAVREEPGLGDAHRIDLGQAGELRLGTIVIRPSLRTLVRNDGVEEILEPRVMQVLIALVEAGGAVVARDTLVDSCWEGRVVGEDAINRVISRLRRVARGIGAGVFRIETVNKVGYRLVPADAPSVERDAVPMPGFTRRSIVVGSGAAALTFGAAGLGWMVFRRGGHRPPAEVAPFMDQAMSALRQGSFGSGNQAIANLRHVVDLMPDYADGWGALACTYALAVQWRPQQFEKIFKDRARAAAARAERLDPGNGFARAAMVLVLPRSGNQLQIERELRVAVAQHPDNDLLLRSLAAVMLAVGRCREAAQLLDKALVSAPPMPGTLYARVQALWAAGRLQEAYRAADDVYALYPTDLAVWFTRFYLLAHTGRAGDALKQAANREGRPRGIPDYSFDVVIVAARAMLSRHAADIDDAIRINLEASHRGCGYAENAMQFAAGLGRLDDAFALAQAYYFARGFSTGELRFLGELDGYTPQNDRRTQLLFMPSTRAMRADPRFDAVVRDLQLKTYWTRAGIRPDYRA